MRLNATSADNLVTLAWPKTDADAVVEQTPDLEPPLWTPATNTVLVGPASFQITVPDPTGDEFFRLRLVQ